MAEIIMQMLVDPVLVGEDDAAETTALTVNMLGGGIDDNMSAEFQRLLLQWRCKHIIDDEACTCGIGDLGHGCNIDHFKRRIGRAFKEEQLGAGANRILPSLEIRSIDKSGFDTIAP